MQTGYYQATAGMVVSFNQLDNITNNLANLNTNGFKKDKVIVGDFMRLYQEKRDNMPLDNHTVPSSKFYNRTMARVPHIVESFTSFDHGPLQQTGNSLDMGMKRDDIFFAVKTPAGVRLTRDGSFSLDKNGVLSTKEGYPVLPSNYYKGGKGNIQFEPGQNVPHVDSAGRIYVDNNEVSQFMIVQPTNMKGLTKEGNSLYKPVDERRFAILKDSDAVSQGFLEKSNVNAVTEMVAMIEAQRMLGMYQKVMDTQMNDLNRDAIEKLAAKA